MAAGIALRYKTGLRLETLTVHGTFRLTVIVYGAACNVVVVVVDTEQRPQEHRTRIAIIDGKERR